MAIDWPGGGCLSRAASGGVDHDSAEASGAAGPHTVRVVELDSDGSAWFSDVSRFTAEIGQTNELAVTVKRGITIRGQLDDTVPRPVKNGRVVAHVSPAGIKFQDHPPQWHAWATVQEDGNFAIGPLLTGNLDGKG